MLDDWVRIEPLSRLRTINRVLDRIVPEFPGEAAEEAIEIMLRAVARGELAQAAMVLENVIQANPFWLRGYLLLATIYQYGHHTEQAIIAIEKGLAMCTRGLRLFRARGWVETVKRITGPVVRSRISNNAERLRRYEGMFRYRLAMLRIHCGCFDEALEHWAAREDEHCAS
jgi:cytochrome c-type biogenesis protein CcmH/NrfG